METINKRQVYNKSYYEKNKELLKKAKSQCAICNCEVLRIHMSRHRRTTKHLNNLNKNVEQQVGN